MDLSQKNIIPPWESGGTEFPLDLRVKSDSNLVTQESRTNYSCDKNITDHATNEIDILDLTMTKNFEDTNNIFSTLKDDRNVLAAQEIHQETQAGISEKIVSNGPDSDFKTIVSSQSSSLLEHSLMLDDETLMPLIEVLGTEKAMKPLEGYEKPTPAIENFLFGQGSSSFEIIHRVSFWETCKHCSMYGKDHFHCLDETCDNLKLVRKDEVMRHLNYHRKRNTCMQRGFLRFSIHESCAHVQPNCFHKGRNTHYHCMHPNCTKVIMNTTDIELHRKHHIRDELIQNEGFLRFSASQNCNTPHCAFINDRTTHFHCARSDCRVTFKEKCGMEKHKSFHAKNDEYVAMGFIKHLKDAPCCEPQCIYSSKLNHFHCLTPGCNFSSHSTSQMVGHQKRHEKMRLAALKKVRKSTQKQSSTTTTIESNSSSNSTAFSADFLPKLAGSSRSSPSQSPLPQTSQYPSNTQTTMAPIQKNVEIPQTQFSLGSLIHEKLTGSLSCVEGFEMRLPGKCADKGCVFQAATHWHCAVERCGFSDVNFTGLKEHRSVHTDFSEKMKSCFEGCERLICIHSNDEELHSHCQVVTKEGSLCDATVQTTLPEMLSHYVTHVPNTRHSNAYTCPCPFISIDHFHCTVEACSSVSLSITDAEQHASRDEHVMNNINPGGKSDASESSFEFEALAPRAKVPRMDSDEESGGSSSIRGLRLKDLPNGVDRLCYSSSEGEDSLNGTPDGTLGQLKRQSDKTGDDEAVDEESMFICVKISEKCAFAECEMVRRRHYHCKVENCTFSTTNVRTFPAHYRKHQSSQRKCQQGYKHFSQKVDCQRSSCIFRRKCAHFHCIRQGCLFSFSTANQMEPHSRKHVRKEMASSPNSAILLSAQEMTSQNI